MVQDKTTLSVWLQKVPNVSSSLWDGVVLVQEPIPVLEQFLELVLEHWSGDQYREEVLQLTSHLSLQPFDSKDSCLF